MGVDQTFIIKINEVDFEEYGGINKMQHNFRDCMGMPKERLDEINIEDEYTKSEMNLLEWSNEENSVYVDWGNGFRAYDGEKNSRGHWCNFAMAWIWFKQNFPDCTIFYGGDGDIYGVMDNDYFNRITQYWAKHGRRPIYNEEF